MKGKRRIERVEIKEPYDFIAKYDLSETKQRILYFLYDMRIASTSQITKHLGYNKRYVQKTLRELCQNQFVYRKFRNVNSGSSEANYFLDNMGAYFIASNEGMTKKEFPWSPRDYSVGMDKVNHTVEITNFRLAMESFVASESIFELQKFYGEKRLGKLSFKTVEVKYDINPDSEIRIICRTGQSAFLQILFLEYDTGLEDIRQIREKIDRYIKFYNSSEISALYEARPQVIISCQNSISRKRFEKVILDLWDDGAKKIEFIIVDHTSFIQNPSTAIFALVGDESTGNLKTMLLRD